jgi:protein tyrosine phosphatase
LVSSAGVGRTGTYMIIDAMLEQVKSNETIDIVNYLKVLRKDRPYMVQTSVSFTNKCFNIINLLHDALLPEFFSKKIYVNF